jgi:hypothetical protein
MQNKHDITDINIHSFNNKADKGDDDFDDWMLNEAPFEPTYTVSIGDITADTIDISKITASTITGINNPNYETKKIKSLKYSMPLDLLYKWFPQEVKEYDDYDDQVPF